MGYNPEGHQLPIPAWNPGITFPNWIKADGIKAPKCLHDIKFVYATGNDVRSIFLFLEMIMDEGMERFAQVTPFIGFEKWEDIGVSVRFSLPYAYINQEKKWFRYNRTAYCRHCLFMWMS